MYGEVGDSSIEGNVGLSAAEEGKKLGEKGISIGHIELDVSHAGSVLRGLKPDARSATVPLGEARGPFSTCRKMRKTLKSKLWK